jgi:DNA-binding MarR family transcriptional regulator
LRVEKSAAPAKLPAELSPRKVADAVGGNPVVTRFYDAALRPSGVGITQFTLLQALTHAAGISQKQLSALLEIDSTTLTRTLVPLRRKGWLDAEAGADRRALRLSLTAAGKREYRRVLPFWQTAQKGLRRALGRKTLTELVDTAVRTAGVMQESG